MIAPVLFCGDPHGKFDQVHLAASVLKPQAVVLLGDNEPERPLEEVMHGLGCEWLFIAGNHDSDSDDMAKRVWSPATEPHNLHGRVVTLPSGVRIGGLAGIFRESVWYPSRSAAREGAPAWLSRHQHKQATPHQDRWLDSLPPRRHLSSIYPVELDRLADLQADILVTHEAPGYHRNGFSLLDDLARSMGVRFAVHGHHHDALDSAAAWAKQGFQTHGVGLRGVSVWWPDDGRWEVVIKGELDDARSARYTEWP